MLAPLLLSLLGLIPQNAEQAPIITTDPYLRIVVEARHYGGRTNPTATASEPAKSGKAVRFAVFRNATSCAYEITTGEPLPSAPDVWRVDVTPNVIGASNVVLIYQWSRERENGRASSVTGYNAAASFKPGDRLPLDVTAGQAWPIECPRSSTELVLGLMQGPINDSRIVSTDIWLMESDGSTTDKATQQVTVRSRFGEPARFYFDTANAPEIFGEIIARPRPDSVIELEITTTRREFGLFATEPRGGSGRVLLKLLPDDTASIQLPALGQANGGAMFRSAGADRQVSLRVRARSSAQMAIEPPEPDSTRVPSRLAEIDAMFRRGAVPSAAYSVWMQATIFDSTGNRVDEVTNTQRLSVLDGTLRLSVDLLADDGLCRKTTFVLADAASAAVSERRWRLTLAPRYDRAGPAGAQVDARLFEGGRASTVTKTDLPPDGTPTQLSSLQVRGSCGARTIVLSAWARPAK